MILGYAIIQLPELIRPLIRFAKAQIYRNEMLSIRKSANRNGKGKLESLRKGANNKVIEVEEMKNFEACEVSEMLLQHELQITSILKRIDIINKNMLHNERH